MFSIQHVYIIGFGRIGKSIVYTLRNNNFKGDVFACNSKINDERIQNDKNINGECNFFSNFENYEKLNNSVIFVCVPPSKTIDILQNLTDRFKNNDNDIVISDACSVKNEIFSENSIVNDKHFIAIHPMDGGNSGEYEFLFKKYILNFVIENKNIDKDVYDKYLSFLEKYLNCKNVVVSYKEHDKIVALISHLSTLVYHCYNNNYSKIQKDIMWGDIFKQNKDNIDVFLNEFIAMYNNDNKNIDEIFKDLMLKNKITIEKGLQNPSLKRVLSLQNKNIDSDFLSNLKDVYNSLVI